MDPTGNQDNAPLVLVVDDFQDNREMFAEYLSFSGFRVAEAATGKAVRYLSCMCPWHYVVCTTPVSRLHGCS